MSICPQCDEQGNDDDERFCISCGMDLEGSAKSITVDTSNSQKISDVEIGTTHNIETESVPFAEEPTLIITHDTINKNGRLVLLPDHKTITEIIDGVQKLIGRADLILHTQKDPDLISRSHFTIYHNDGKYIICDGSTNVQDRSSKHGTFVNGIKLKESTPMELNIGDKISISDINMKFEVT